MDQEFELKHGALRAVIGSFGASLRQFYLVHPSGLKNEIIWGYSGRENKKAGQGDVLVPFPNRIKNGRYEFEGKTHQMALNDKEGPNSIHGFLRSEQWQVLSQTPDAVELSLVIQKEVFKARGYPFSLEVKLEYKLSPSGLAVNFSILNIGDTNAPVGIGFHPYFQVGTEFVDTSVLCIPANRVLEVDDKLIPTGKQIDVTGTPLDFRVASQIGSQKINLCYSDLKPDPDQMTRVKLRNPQNGFEVTLTMDPVFKYFVVYTGDSIGAPLARKAIGLEPMTCATDAFNRPSWGLQSLAPRAKFQGQFTIEVAQS
jgi:aldose 1-epimerase